MFSFKSVVKYVLVGLILPFLSGCGGVVCTNGDVVAIHYKLLNQPDCQSDQYCTSKYQSMVDYVEQLAAGDGTNWCYVVKRNDVSQANVEEIGQRIYNTADGYNEYNCGCNTTYNPNDEEDLDNFTIVEPMEKIGERLPTEVEYQPFETTYPYVSNYSSFWVQPWLVPYDASVDFYQDTKSGTKDQQGVGITTSSFHDIYVDAFIPSYDEFKYQYIWSVRLLNQSKELIKEVKLRDIPSETPFIRGWKGKGNGSGWRLARLKLPFHMENTPNRHESYSLEIVQTSREDNSSQVMFDRTFNAQNNETYLKYGDFTSVDQKTLELNIFGNNYGIDAQFQGDFFNSVLSGSAANGNTFKRMIEHLFDGDNCNLRIVVNNYSSLNFNSNDANGYPMLSNDGAIVFRRDKIENGMPLEQLRYSWMLGYINATHRQNQGLPSGEADMSISLLLHNRYAVYGLESGNPNPVKDEAFTDFVNGQLNIYKGLTLFSYWDNFLEENYQSPVCLVNPTNIKVEIQSVIPSGWSQYYPTAVASVTGHEILHAWATHAGFYKGDAEDITKSHNYYCDGKGKQTCSFRYPEVGQDMREYWRDRCNAFQFCEAHQAIIGNQMRSQTEYDLYRYTAY